MYSALSGDVPLVGRSLLLSAIADMLRSGELYGAFVYGDMGTGKSAMARHLVTRLQGEFVPFLVTPASSLGSIPYGALSPFLTDATAADMASPLSVLRRVMTFLRSRAKGRPVVVLVDDAHLLDDDSSHLLAQLVTSRTVRLAAFARSTPSLSDELASLCRDGLLGRFDVGPLDYAEAHELCTRVLGAEVVRGTSDRLCDEASGNPLFLKAVLDEALATGTLSKLDGIWTLTADTVTFPRSLVDLVRAVRLALDESERTVFDVVALGGLVAFTDLVRLSSEAAVSALIREGVISSSPEHPAFALHTSSLHARITRGLLPVGRSSHLFRLLSDPGASALPLPSRAEIQRALWSLDVGLPAAEERLLELADLALTLLDPDAALRLAAAARSEQSAMGARLRRASALLELSRVAEARQLSVGLLEAGTSPEAITAAGILEVRLLVAEGGDATGVDGIIGRWSEALHGLEAPDHAALMRGEDDLTLWRAFGLNLVGRYSYTVEVLEPLLADGSTAQRVLGPAHSLMAEALGALGRGTQGSRHSEIALSEVPLQQVPDLHRMVFLRHVALLVHTGDYRGAEQALEHYRAEAGRAYSFVGGVLAVFDAAIDARRGSFQKAMVTLRPALALLRTSDPEGFLPYALGIMAWAGAARGEAELVHECSTELAAVEHRGSRESALRAQAFTAGASALLDAAPGAPALLKLAVEARHRGWSTCEKDILELAAWLGDDRSVQRLAEVAGALEGTEASVLHAYASALIAQDGAALVAVADRAEAAGKYLLSTNASKRAMDAFAGTGDSRSQRALAGVVRRRRTLVDGAALVEPATLEVASPLTSREREIAVLALRGLSNREIADRLTVSTRTVEGHLYRIYVKLGISRREELTSELEPFLGAG
jgi:DNA-binding NarL/FixJ family response regulator